MRAVRALALACVALASTSSRGEPRERVASDRSTTITRELDEQIPSRGPDLAPVTIEVFCSYILAQCAQIDAILAALSDRHPERLRIVYRQLPVPYREGHLLAEAAVEAHAQGRFFEFSAEVYAKWLSEPPSKRNVERIAQRVGLDADRLRAALADGRHKPRVDADVKRRELFEIRAAPALVWNGRVITVPADLEEFEELYDRSYEEAQDLVAEGVSLRRLYPLLLRRAAAERSAEQRRHASHHTTDAGELDLNAPRFIVPQDRAPSRGPEDARVTIVMFGDFECPFCRRTSDNLRRLEELYPAKLRIVFKHLPIASHANARRAAEFAACAQLQGEFWPYHDRLFQNARDLKRASLQRYADELGLDAKRLADDVQAGRCDEIVAADLKDAEKLGVDSAPTLFVNGLRLVQQRSMTDLKHVIEEELRPGLLEELTETEAP